MVLTVSFNEEIQSAAANLDNSCRACCSGLFFASSFYPKIPLDNADNVVQFWYAVTNLYGFFYDCAPYVFQEHKQYLRLDYATNAPKPLLEVFLKEQLISESEKKEI